MVVNFLVGHNTVYKQIKFLNDLSLASNWHFGVTISTMDK